MLVDNTTGATGPSASTPVPEVTKDERRHLLALSWGHALEWFDWAVFGLLSVYIGAAFFPADSVLASTLNALAVFAVGFVARPIGGVVLGFVADRVGRKRIMLAAITTVALASFVIGVLPTFETIGYAAPIIIVTMRLLQGLSAGIEAPLGTAYALELVPGRPGYVAGYFAFFNNLGNLLAPLTAFFMTLILGPEQMGEWGWRVPFILGGVLGLVVLYLRRTLPETLHTRAIKMGEKPDPLPVADPGVWASVRQHWLSIIAIIFIVGAMQSFMYTFLAGMPNLANGAFAEDPSAVFAVTTGLGIFLTIGAFMLRSVLDKVALSRWFIAARLLTIPAIFLILFYSGAGIGMFVFVMAVGGVLILLNGTIFVVIANSMLPQHCRGTGVGLGYGIGVALFGGTASYMLIWLQDAGVYWMFPAYVAVLCALSVLFYVLAKRKHGIYVGR